MVVPLKQGICQNNKEHLYDTWDTSAQWKSHQEPTGGIKMQRYH